MALVLLDLLPYPEPGIGRLFSSPAGLLTLVCGLVAGIAAVLWLRRR